MNLANWNWYSPNNGPGGQGKPFGDLGGGYHFMRLEGMYDSSGVKNKPFKTHMGKARNITAQNDTLFENNHYTATLTNSTITVSKDFSFDINMKIDQWYVNTFTWDFNVYNAPIMPVQEKSAELLNLAALPSTVPPVRNN